MKAGDTEATQGLERSKGGSLKKPEGDPKFVYAPPKLVSEQPVSVPARSKDAAVPSTPSGAVSSTSPAPAPSTASAAPKPSSSRSVLPRSEATRTAPTAVLDTTPPASRAPRASEKPRSVPPPLPPVAPKDAVLEAEIDASLDNLELGPTGTSLPEAPLAHTGETLARDEVPSTLDAPVMPHTIRESFRTPSGATDPPPATLAATGESPITHEEMESGDLVDFDEPTGTGIEIDQVLESTHTGTQSTAPGADDEIVIADDLAEDLDDDALKDDQVKAALEHEAEEEHTDAGGTLPPFRSGS
jgi:hypothetical protein